MTAPAFSGFGIAGMAAMHYQVRGGAFVSLMAPSTFVMRVG